MDPTGVWARLRELDQAATQAYQTLARYSVDELRRPDVIERVAAFSVYPLHPHTHECGYHKGTGDAWRPPRPGVEEPILWRHVAGPFRNLVDELFPLEDRADDSQKKRPEAYLAYFALLVSLQAFIGPSQDSLQFRYAAFEAEPALGGRDIDKYVADGYSVTNLLFSVPWRKRKPIVMMWNAAGVNPLSPDFWADGAHYLVFTSRADGRDFRPVGPLDDIETLLESIKVSLGSQDPRLKRRQLDRDEARAEFFKRMAVTVRGYRSHIERERRRHPGCKDRPECERFMGIFLPASSTPYTRTALFLLFDFTGRRPPRPAVRLSRAAVLLSRSLEGIFNNWQALKTQEANERVQQRSNFAHQTSAVIDVIVRGFQALPPAVREAVDPYFTALLHVLQATIHSYRTSQVWSELGEFSYPWDVHTCPLRVYRHLGFQLGLARCQDATNNEKVVRAIGKYLSHPETQPGTPALAQLEDRYVGEAPASPEGLWGELRQSGFAVLALLTLKQAVYHTVRAQKLGGVDRKVGHEFGVTPDGVLTYVVRNPAVPSEQGKTRSKDAEELNDLATRLSETGAFKYEVDGPRPADEAGWWVTLIRVWRVRTR